MIFDRIRKDKAGNFALITALIAAPLMGMVGLAVDFADALMARSTYAAAADAAIVGSISEKSSAVSASFKMGEDGAVELGQSDALKIFTAQLSPASRAMLTKTDVTVKKNGAKLLATLTYHAKVPTTFLRVLGKNTVDIAGTATAEFQTHMFRDFYLLLDNTPSMGVAATPADVAKMVAATSDKCAFACHINNNGSEDPKDYYNLAKKLGVTIRIDVVAKATAALMDTATGQRSTSDQYRMAIYTFGEKAEDTKLLEVSPLTVDLALAKSKASKIQLMTIPYQGYNNDQQTSFDISLKQIKTKIGTQGNGLSSGNPEKIIFFVSDGVGDSYKPDTCTKKTTGGRCRNRSTSVCATR